ncbi:MAG: PAS domain-containing protein [Sphingomonadaceae bacterium]|nr:PAS domain-containing protein [Sphingomonadaceae bacterium]
MLNAIQNLEGAQVLARAIVNTIPDPFVVLDHELRVLAASRSFYETFRVDPDATRGVMLYALGDGQWDIPALRILLETILPERRSMDGFEVEHDFPGIGPRTMLLNARQVVYDDSDQTTILLAFSDITARRAIEREKEELLAHTSELLRQKQILLQEMEHRVANSLSIIASILMLKARAVTSDETRHHLEDAHQRVMSVATVQSHLHASAGVDRIEVRAYLSKLGDGLAASMVGESQPVEIRVIADDAKIESAKAVSLGLIVTELVINALKYAFPDKKTGALILVTYEIEGTDWKLVVSDNGVGKIDDKASASEGGLGTTIVKALAKQLDARVESLSDSAGLKVCVTRATFTSRMPQAA